MYSSQQQKLLAVLEANKGAWVPLPSIMALGIAQYNARIYELRRLGYDIKNKTKEINGVKHSWFCLPGPEGPSMLYETGEYRVNKIIGEGVKIC